MTKNSYLKLFLMLAASFVIMYGVMFLNVFSTSHIYISTTRTYMTLLMIAPMAILKLLFMWKMYPNKKINASILSLAVVVAVLAFVGLRKQTGISDTQYMKAMIPHHSSAILTSKNADIKDSEVQELAKDIIEAQEKEISLMKEYISRIEEKE